METSPSGRLGEGRTLASLARLLGLFLLAAIAPDRALGQNCGCPPDLCCSRFGYCGSSADYCGDGCQRGPCNVASVVTQSFFDGIVGAAGAGCPGKGFYNWTAFEEAVGSYPSFGRVGSTDDSLREVAAFFAHVAYETGGFCYVEEVGGAARDYCDESNTRYPCVAGKAYYGRGPIQLSWNYNYGAAGQSIGFDGLGSPETVAKDAVISFKTALWFWMNNVHSVIGRGFGATIRAFNVGECNGGNPAAVSARVGYYRDYCSKLKVQPGDNLTNCDGTSNRRDTDPIGRFRVGLFILST